MNAPQPRGREPQTRRGDHGFTLVELMIAIVLSLMIGGVVVAALLTSLNAARTTTAEMSDSTDAGLISSFLVRDAQSAGGIDPGTALRDPTLGVSNVASAAGWGGCSQSGVFVLRFSWMDRTTATTSVVTYAGVPDPLDGTKQQLIRRLCTNGTQADVVLGRNININPPATFATCQNPDFSSGCGSQSTSVTLTVTGKDTPTALVSILTASLRSTSSQLTIIGPASLPGGQVGAPYPSIFLTTIGASVVAANGTHADPTWSASGLPNGLSVAPSNDKSAGVIFGTPTGAVGHYPVTITVTDALGAKASKAYTIDVHAPPSAVAEGYSTSEDLALTEPAAAGVLANDSSPEGKSLTAILYSGVANGSLTFNSDGSFIYTPRANFNGADSFKYKAYDGSLSSNIVTVNLTVSAINDPPVNRVPVAQETPKNTSEVFTGSAFIAISDVDAGSANVQVQLKATNGTVTLPNSTGLASSTGSGTAVMTITGTIAKINLSLVGATFTPTANFTGAAALQIVTNDLGNSPLPALSDTDSVAINVTNLGIFTANQDVGNVKLTGSSSSASSTAYTVSGSGKDIWENNFDGFQFIYRPMTGDGSLTARIASEDVTYNGVHNPTLLCWAADNSHQQPCISVAKSEVMFRQDLTNVSAMHASVGMTQGNGSEYIYRTTAGASTGAASPGDSLSFPYWVRLTRLGDQLTAEISPDGVNWTQRGTPQTIAMGSPVYVGLASSAVYQLDTTTNQAKKLNTTMFDNVSISTPPTAAADAYFANEDTTLTVPATSGVLFNDSDPEGSPLTAALVTGTTGLTLNPDGSFTYVPPANFSGTASFTYTADDGVFNSPTTTVTITVNPANETPSFTKGADQSIVSNLGPQITAGWATAISQGTGETGQLVDFIVTNTNNSLFSVQPAISADGTLTYTSAADATGTATVSVSIHDNGGTANGAADTSAVQTFTITVDDPPVVTATATSLAYTENATTVLDPGVTVSDSDNANMVSATVTMTANYVNGQDTLAFVNQNGITGTWTPATGVLALSGSSSVANYQAALRSITYNNNSDNPTTATRTVTFVVNDGVLFSNIASRTITVTAVSDAPVVTATGTTLAYPENSTPPLDAGIVVTDADSVNLASVTVDMTTNYLNGEDTLAFVNQNGITGSWNAATGVLTLSGSSSVANYQAALRSITYNDNSHTPNTSLRTVTFMANDGGLDSNIASRTITVTAINDAPVNSVPASQATAMNTAKVFSTANGNLISTSDVDAGSSLVQVQLVSTNGTTTLSGISGLTFSAGDGTADATMTFTGTIANVNAALAGLSFNPTTTFTGAASLKIVTNDQGFTGTGGALTDTDTIAITVAKAPVVAATGTLAYIENGTSAVAPAATVTDADSTNLASATVTMSANYVNGQDTLAFVNQLGITGTWNAATGVLTLSGSTTVVNYQTALRAITYNNNSDNPNTGARTVTFVVNDGLLDSNISSHTITVAAVNDAPVVTPSGGSMAYTENGTTVLDPGITVTDVDSANMASATVSMTTNKVVAQDVLAFTNQNGITGTFTASTGVLVLSGSSSVGNYQAALRSITYNNNSDNPTTTTRTVTVVVNDSAANSNIASRTITLTAVNDAPVNTVPGAQSTAKNIAKVFSAANSNLISISDVDAGAANLMQIQLVSTNGKATLSRITGLTFTVGANGQATMTFTGTIANVNAALAGLSFAPTVNFTGAASLQIVTNDQGFTGTGGSLIDTETIAITVT